MKIALCTTTIHIPHTLKVLHKCIASSDANVRFFVACDLHTPGEVEKLCDRIGNAEAILPEYQGAWKCSDLLGWNTIARRNIAFLTALQWGADVIYSWDDDNIPLTLDHFHNLEHWQWSGPCISSFHNWFDPGNLLVPPTRHRGFPYDKKSDRTIATVTDAKIGVSAGLIVGNPDVDASTRMELKPDIAQTHIMGQTGVAVAPGTWTVFNTQNTAVIRDLIPAWFMLPGVGRMDDIYASLIVQRVARESGHHIHFGPPVCFQQRHEHNLVADLRAEIDGYEKVTRLVGILDALELPTGSVLANTNVIYNRLLATAFITAKQHDAAIAWLEDVEGVL